jgi:hypothetical protein
MGEMLDSRFAIKKLREGIATVNVWAFPGV